MGAQGSPNTTVYDGGFIRVESIDGGGITFTLFGTDPFFLSGQNLEGSYTALRCP